MLGEPPSVQLALFTVQAYLPEDVTSYRGLGPLTSVKDTVPHRHTY